MAFKNENLSSIRTPIFDGTNYSSWSYAMSDYMQGKSFRMWKIIQNGDLKVHKRKYVTGQASTTETDPEKAKADGQVGLDTSLITDLEDIDINDLDDGEITKIELNASARSMLYNSLTKEEQNRIQRCKTAKEIWDCLKATHEGTSQVKNARISLLTREYEMFHMEKGETIRDMQGRFEGIVNNLRSLGRNISTRDLNSKILSSLNEEYDTKTCAIEESKDLEILPFEELMGSLVAEELKLKHKKLRVKDEEKPTRKNLALQSKVSNFSNDEEVLGRLLAKMEQTTHSDDEDDDAMAMFARKFKKHFGKRNFRKGETSTHKFGGKNDEQKKEPPRCFYCDKLGHIKPDCPKLKEKYPQRKAMKAQKFDGHSSDEESIIEEEEEVANVANLDLYHEAQSNEDYTSDDEEEIANEVCKMAKGELEVSSKSIHDNDNDSNNDIHEAFDELYEDHKTSLLCNRKLTKENKTLIERLAILEKEVHMLKASPKDDLVLKEKLAKTEFENESLRISLSKFKLSELSQKKIIDTQVVKVDRSGIGFVGYSSNSFSNIQQGNCSKNSLPSTPIFVKASHESKKKEPMHMPHKKNKHTCTYCQKGNHPNSLCYIRKLCEMGTLIPAWKKPKWVVKTTQKTNPLGPKESWVPRKQT